MLRTYMKYTAVLIAMYLAVSHASGAGSLITNAAQGATNIDKTLQGR